MTPVARRLTYPLCLLTGALLIMVAAALHPDLERHLIENAWGQVNARPGLDVRTRPIRCEVQLRLARRLARTFNYFSRPIDHDQRALGDLRFRRRGRRDQEPIAADPHRDVPVVIRRPPGSMNPARRGSYLRARERVHQADT